MLVCLKLITDSAWVAGSQEHRNLLLLFSRFSRLVGLFMNVPCAYSRFHLSVCNRPDGCGWIPSPLTPVLIHRVQMGPFTDTILGQLGDLLSLEPSETTLLNRDDQLYLFETVSVLIISAAADNKV